MKRDLVRAVTVAGSVLCMSAMSCPETLGPEGLIPPGDWRLVRSIAEAEWEVPAPQGTVPGCGRLLDARLLIGEDGSVLHTRSIRHEQNGALVTTVQDLTPTLEKSAGSDTHLQYRGWYEIIRAQREPREDDPYFTVLYVQQTFRGSDYCPWRELMLRYTIGGVNH